MKSATVPRSINLSRLPKLLALLGVLALPSMAQADNTAADNGAAEGIKVHGDWTLTLLNEQGEVERRVEFKNALRYEGKELLVGLLTGTSIMFNDPNDGELQWGLRVEPKGTIYTDECKEELGQTFFVDQYSPMRANIRKSTESFNLSRTLVLPANCLINGTSYTIHQVASVFTRVPVPAGGTIRRTGVFTSKTLSTPVSVRARQPVILDVTFSFN